MGKVDFCLSAFLQGLEVTRMRSALKQIGGLDSWGSPPCAGYVAAEYVLGHSQRLEFAAAGNRHM